MKQPPEPEYEQEQYGEAYAPEEDEYLAPPKKRTIFKPRLHRPNFILAVIVNAVRMLFLVVFLLGLAAAGAVFGIAKGYVETAPTLDLAALDDQAKTSFIYDSQGNVITDYKGTENRVMASISQMPKNLQNAFVAVEDARFYTHNGVDVKRIIGSFVSNFANNTNQGGSTITQQLIKNTVLSSEQSYKRKIQEAYLAMQLETMYTKSEILECYLNTIYLGENYYGVSVAAEGYFGKDMVDLSLRECAMLAGLTNNPYYYNPRRNFYIRQSEETDYAKLTNDRTDYVLRCMYENQFITYQEYQQALEKTSANVLEKGKTEGDGMYPYAHYVEYAVKEVVSKFLEIEGLSDTSENRAKMESKLRTGGYHVTLAIDTEIQQIVEDTLENWNSYPALRDPSDKVYKARNSDGTYTEIVQPQAAAVVLDYRTGELKAIVGGRTKPTQRKTLNRATDMQMPVGSAIKPIAVYAPALELGASPASVVFNLPLPISGWTDANNKDTWPKNYGGGKYTGADTLRKAMQQSRNVSAAQTMMSLVGVDNAVSFLLKMGVNSKNIDRTPFGVTLGSSGITPVEMAVCYGVLGNGGRYQEPISFLGISDSSGNVVYDSHANQEQYQVFKPSTAYMIVDMMKSVVSGGTGTSAKISGQTVAGKTGTNSDQKGIYFCGLTGWYASSVWVGHDNYKSLSSKATGSSDAAPLWQSYMKKIHEAKGLNNRDILEGNYEDYGLVKVTTCNVSGQLATDACRSADHTTTDYWLRGTQPAVDCQMHQTVALCATTGQLANPYCPYQTPSAVVTIPKGHPLYKFIDDPEYASVLTQYLGAGAGASTCTLHSASYTGEGDQNPIVQNTLLPDASVLLESANALLYQLDPSSNAYINLFTAISNLQNVISGGNPSTAAVASAMAQLTQAMAAAQ